MASIVRLKGLDVNATAEDIRDFFPRLHIPVRGVWIWILGGPQHEAFIAFKSQTEARRAVHHNGRSLKGSKVNIRLSSVSELEHKLENYMKKHSLSKCLPRVAEKALPPRVVHPQTSPPRDPRTASACSPPISPPPVPSGDEQTFDEPHDRKLPSNITPTGCLQSFVKPCEPRTAPIVNGGPQMRDRPCDPRTIPVRSGLPQVCDEIPELRISSPTVPSDFLQTSDESHSPQKCKQLVPSQGPLNCDEAVNNTTSTPGECVQNSDQTQNSDPLHNAFLLGVRTVLENLQSFRSEQREVLPEHGRQEYSSAIMPETPMSVPGYVRLFGLPASTTKADICSFFKGLTVGEVVVNMKLEHRHVCLVKFDNKQDSVDALQFNNQYLGHICVEVRKATDMMWNLALEECNNTCHKDANNSLTDAGNRKHKLRLENYNPPKKARRHYPYTEYVVKVCNLPLLTTKTDIKKVFECHEIERSKIQHLLDKNGDRTDTAFLLFNQKTDCEHAMSRDGSLVDSCHIKVSEISRDEMMQLKRENDWPQNLLKRRSHRSEMLEKNKDAKAKTCLLVQNMPESLKESLMAKLSHKCNARKDDIIILSDNGKASCTAMVQFNSLKLVSIAHKLSKDLLGENAITKRITANQMSLFADEGLH